MTQITLICVYSTRFSLYLQTTCRTEADVATEQDIFCHIPMVLVSRAFFYPDVLASFC